MKIKQKLTLGFISISLLVAIVGYVSVKISQNALQKSIGESSEALAAGILGNIDRGLYRRIEIFQEYSKELITQRVVAESNRKFEELGDIQSYIDEMDRQWLSVPKEEVTPFMHQLMNNELAENLREKIKYYEEKYGYRVFAEVFVTNKYGANVGQSGKTSDYNQSDESWWQESKKNGLYVTDVEYDKSSDVYSTNLCIRIDDPAGNFLGVTKVVLNIQEVISLLKKEEQAEKYAQFKLLTKARNVIYSTEKLGFSPPTPLKLSCLLDSHEDKQSQENYFIAAGDNHGEKKELFAYARSTGFRDFKGLGWILVIEREADEIFAPAIRLRNLILIISLVITALALFLGLFISKTISGSIGRLAVTATEIGKGNLDARVEVKSKDEIGQLADTFNKMAEDLQKTTTSIDNLNAANQQLQASQQQLRANEQQLKANNQQLHAEIAERKNAEGKSKSEHEFSQIIIDTAQAIILVLDTEGKIVDFNPYMEEISGYRIKEVKGKDWFETFIDPAHQAHNIRELFKKSIGGIPVHGQVNPIFTKDGCEIEIEWYDKTLTDADGKATGILSIGQDITEHLEYEQKLRLAKRQAESANEAKSRFLANMSHEIRTPMNAIIGFSDLLADGNLSEKQRGYIATVKDSGQNLLRIIDDILDFSKIEAGRLDIEITKCSLAALLNSVESLMKPKAIEKGIEFEIVEAGGLPAQISTDTTRLRQCLINLTDNAIKFTEQGHVYLNVALEENSEKQPFIRFGVEDTGIGIAPEKQELIFESFTQADGDTTRKYGGTGLGLTITKRLTELLGGKLNVTSEKGKGSVFSIVIPAGVDVTEHGLLDRHNIAGYTELSEPEVGQSWFSGTVLVAEDNSANQMLIKLLLEKLGFEVTVAEDGDQALKKVKSKQFDLIFMDMMMPNMNGYETTRAIKAEGIKTPVIALTANAMADDGEKCLKAGCDEYLSKPLSRKDLLKVLNKYITRV